MRRRVDGETELASERQRLIGIRVEFCRFPRHDVIVANSRRQSNLQN
jgi:hypothetical protein